MTDPQELARARLRKAAYWLLILTSTGGMLGRVLSVTSDDGRTPFLSANDRSRWCTIRALVDDHTYAIDRVIVKDPDAKQLDKKFDKAWFSIDMVRHRGPDGKEHYYSSKPTLLPLLMAGPYWVIHRLSGATIAKNPFYIGRATLIVVNVLPLMLGFVLLGRMVERYGTTDWGRVFAMACATWGTFLTTFAVTLNNHVPAALCVLVAIYSALAVWRDGRRGLHHFALAGFFAAFAAANELPALAFAAAVTVAMLWKAPLRTLLVFVPAAALVVAAFFGTNHWAHGSWIPAYAHRGKDGPRVASVDASLMDELNEDKVPAALRESVEKQAHIKLSPKTVVSEKDEGRWVLWDESTQRRLAVVRSGDELVVHTWGDWYDYPLSYWTTGRKQGVDRGEPSRLDYAFHVTVGHHGIFSLTPIWLPSAVGLVMMLLRRSLRFRGFAVMVLLVTLVCLAFYIARPLADRNYGGVTCGLRWMFWFAPLWLLCLLPFADAAAVRPPLRWIALLLLVASVASAAYGWSNPWSHPWLYDYWVYQGLPVPH